MGGYLLEPSKHCITAELSGCTKNAMDCRTEFLFMSSSGISTLCGCRGVGGGGGGGGSD